MLESTWEERTLHPSPVGELMKGIQPPSASGKLDELEAILAGALEVLGESDVLLRS